MKSQGKHLVRKKVIAYEAAAFAGIIILIWLDELIDLPHLLWGAVPTPVNWGEAVFESAAALFVGLWIIYITGRLFHRMKYLEGILPVCASCKRIRDDKGSWHQLESYISDESDARFSHGICPECARKLYPEFKSDKDW